MSIARAAFRSAISSRRQFRPSIRILQRSTAFLKAHNSKKVLFLPAVVGIVKAASLKEDITTSLAYIIHQADLLYEGNKFLELYDLLLPHKDSNEVDLLWRFARAAYSLSQHSDGERKLELLKQGYEAAEYACTLKKSALSYKWLSILLDSYSAAQGFRERCHRIMEVKEHMIKSVELDPTDATVLYILGVWFYEIADLAWYKRKILNAAGGVNPTASYEEALEYFEKAETTSPDFYSLNLLMLGKTYLKLGNDEKAQIYLKKAADYPDLSDDDHRARKEAADLLKKLKT